MKRFRIPDRGLRNGGTTILAAALALSLFTAPLTLLAQQTDKGHRIGLLLTAPRAQIQSLVKALGSGLREAGYVEGQNVALIYRSAEGKPERLPALAEELVKLGVDLIVATSTPAAAAVKQATARIPVVMVSPADPVAAGLVTSLAHPGGNITGVTLEVSAETAGKQLDLLKECLPRADHVAILWNPAYPPNAPRWKAMQEAGKKLGIALVPAQVRDVSEMGRSFNEMIREGAEALLVLGDPLTFSLRGQIASMAGKYKLPTMSPYREAAEAGGLIAYGPDFPHMYRRAGSYIARILDGVKPHDLPVEQPTKFDLIINLKAAKALGLTIPQSLLMRADEVIQ